MNCIRCSRERGHGVVLLEVADVHGGMYMLCGVCMHEDIAQPKTAPETRVTLRSERQQPDDDHDQRQP